MRKLLLSSAVLGLLAATAPASAAYYGEVAAFAFKFCPKGWDLANGDLRHLERNTTMFPLIRNEYGGEYPNTFAVPDLTDHPPTLPDASAKDRGKLTWCIRMRDGIFPARPD